VETTRQKTATRTESFRPAALRTPLRQKGLAGRAAAADVRSPAPLRSSQVAPLVKISPQRDLSRTPENPIVSDAATSRARIDNSSDGSLRLIRALALARRRTVTTFFSGHRQAAANFIEGSIQKLDGFLRQQQSAASAWLLARAAAVQGFFFSLLPNVMAIGTSIINRVQSGITALTGGVFDLVNSVIDQVLKTARSIPIPDIPGLGRVRSAILNAAEDIAAVIRRALAHVQSFIARLVSLVLIGIRRLIVITGTALLTTVMRLMSLVARAIAVIKRLLTALRQRFTATLRVIARRVLNILIRMESAALAHINRAERKARSSIEANRRQGHAAVELILALCLSQEQTAAALRRDKNDREDSGSSKKQLAASAHNSFLLAMLQVRRKNARVVQQFQIASSQLVSAAVALLLTFLTLLWAGFRQTLQQIQGRVASLISLLRQQLTALATLFVSGARRLITALKAQLTAMAALVITFIRDPLTTLRNAVHSITTAVRGFLQRVISRLVRLFSSVTGQRSGDAAETTTVTGTLDQVSPSRLNETEKSSSSPVAALVTTVTTMIDATVRTATSNELPATPPQKEAVQLNIPLPEKEQNR